MLKQCWWGDSNGLVVARLGAGVLSVRPARAGCSRKHSTRLRRVPCCRCRLHCIFPRSPGEWSCWTDFGECSVATGCGEGVRKRARTCSLKGAPADGCDGPSESLEPCYVPCRNVDAGGWDDWSEWSACDRDNRKYRTRRCALERCPTGLDVETASCFEANNIHGKRNPP